MRKLVLLALMVAACVSIYAFTVTGHEDPCPNEGKPNPKKGKSAVLKPREKNVNKHKNRQSIPGDADYDKTVTIEKMYDCKDDSIWNEENAAAITGYVFRAVDNNMESCNCYTEDKTKYSTNIYLSLTPIDKQTSPGNCIVINVREIDLVRSR